MSSGSLKNQKVENRSRHELDAEEDRAASLAPGSVTDYLSGPLTYKAQSNTLHLERLGFVGSCDQMPIGVRDQIVARWNAHVDLLAACEAAAAVLPGLEVHSWPPGHQMKADALLALRDAIAKARGGK